MLTEYVFRLSLTGASSFLRGRAGLLDELRIFARVWPTDIDIFGHVNNGRYLTLMDYGRTDFLIRTGLWAVTLKRRWRPVLGAATVEFKRELTVGQHYELATRLCTWNEKWFYFEQRFEREGALHALGFVKGVMKHGRKTVPPNEFARAMGQSEQPPSASHALRAWIASQQPAPDAGGPATRARPHPL